MKPAPPVTRTLTGWLSRRSLFSGVARRVKPDRRPDDGHPRDRAERLQAPQSLDGDPAGGDDHFRDPMLGQEAADGVEVAEDGNGMDARSHLPGVVVDEPHRPSTELRVV